MYFYSILKLFLHFFNFLLVLFKFCVILSNVKHELKERSFFLMTKNCKTFAFAFFIGILFFANIVKAECDGFYLAARAGGAKIEIDDSRSIKNGSSNYVIDKNRFIASGALGYRYKHIRAEAEYTWRKKNKGSLAYGITDASFKSQSYMFVLYYDFFPYYWFTPYINAGVGMTQNRLKIKNNTAGATVYNVKDEEFTWSLGAGISVKLTNRWNADFGYRYYDMGDLSILNGKTDVKNQEVYVGLRYVLN